MLYLQKGRFQRVVRWLGGSWMTPNMATVGAVLCIAAVSACFYLGLTWPNTRYVLLLIPIFLFLRLAMNTLDGLLARELNQGSVAGEIWNEALDVLGDTICYGSLFFVPDGPQASLVILLLAIWAAEFFGVLGKGMPGGVRRHESFLGGKPDRAVWMGLLALILYFAPGFMPYVPYYLAGVSALVILTALLRIHQTVKAAAGKPYTSFTWIRR